MKVSAIKGLLSEKDILNAIQEYVEVEGLSINKIEIRELINVEGIYKKGVGIPFKATLGIGKINGNRVYIKILDVAIAKLGILKVVKNFALKSFLKDFENNGIVVEKENLIVDLDIISKVIPYVYFRLKSISIIKGGLEFEVEDLIYAPNKVVEKLGKVKASERNDLPKLQDTYAKARNSIDKKVPDKYRVVLEYAMIIPDIVALLWRLLRDKRVDMKIKVLIGGIIGYLAMPIDILPDFIPFIGKIDDIAIAFFGLQKVINDVPKDVIIQNWQGDEDIFTKVDEGVKYIYAAVGSHNVAKLLEFIKKLTKKGKVQGAENEKCSDIH